METGTERPTSIRTPKIELVLWMSASTPSPIECFANLVALRKFLRERGIATGRRLLLIPPLDALGPELLRVFARQSGVPVDHYGPLENWRGLGVLRVGTVTERDALAASLSGVVRDLQFLGALARIRELCADDEENYPFGVAATEAYREYLERTEVSLIDSDGRAWSDEEISGYKKWRSEPGTRCLELIESWLFG